MARTEYSYCRICEPACPLVASFDDDGKVMALTPDLDHPSGGVACHKGLSYLDVHNDPDRLNWPIRRTNPRTAPEGNFERVSWDAAFADIGEKLRAVRDRYGPNAIAFYKGNPAAFSTAGQFVAAKFQTLLGSRMRFGAVTLDTSNKFVAANAIFGTPAATWVPDLYHTDYLLVLGSNPKVSRWTMVSAPNNMDIVKQIRNRGGKVRFVNPRRTESSTEETGPTIRIRPGADVYFLAALLCEIDRLNGFDAEVLERYARNIEGMRAFVRLYPPQRVEKVTGLDASSITEIAREIVEAPSAAVYMATGVNQSRQGVLCAWLSEMVNLMTGNLGRKGGVFKPAGLNNDYPPVKAWQTIETSLGSFTFPDPFGYTAMPATLLPDLIDSGDIRAVVSVCGNMLLSLGGEERLRLSFEKLDIMVSIDLYRTATGEISDYVLPAADWIERADVTAQGSGLQLMPYVQYADALEPPAAERRTDAWILSRLAMAVSGADAVAEGIRDEEAIVGSTLATAGLSAEQLRASPHRTALLPAAPYDSLFELCLQHPDGKIDCCPDIFRTTGLLDRCAAIFEEVSKVPAEMLQLISLRTPYMHNSWMANVDRLRQGQQASNPLHISEADAVARGLHEGDLVRITSEAGELDVRIAIDDDLRPGVVAMSHGYGHASAKGMRVASAKPGANINRLMPTGARGTEPLSQMSWLSGIFVKVERQAEL